MITPVDFRNKSFRTGIGYDKKDVDSFMVELLRNYEELYRSNAQQISEIKDLSDNIIRYQAMEDTLQRELMVAEKTSEEMIQEAADKAKKIESDAKAKAKQLIKTAKEDLAFTHTQTISLARMYASMKAQLNMIFKSYVDIVNGEDLSMDIDAMEAFGAVPEEIIDAINASEVVPEMNFAASAYIQKMPAGGKGPQSGGGAAFGSFDGDPQMRDESPLGGMSDGAFTGTISGERGDVATAGFGFSSLAENEAYKDPFDGVDVESTNEYNDDLKDPFGGQSSKNSQAAPKRTKKKPAPTPQYTEPDYQESGYASPAYDESAPAEDYAQSAGYETSSDYEQPQYDAPQYDAPQYDAPQYDAPQYDAPQYDAPQYDAPNYAGTENYQNTAAGSMRYTEEIPTVNFEDDYADEESDALSGDIEDKKAAGPRLLGNGDDEDDDFSFT